MRLWMIAVAGQNGLDVIHAAETVFREEAQLAHHTTAPVLVVDILRERCAGVRMLVPVRDVRFGVRRVIMSRPTGGLCDQPGGVQRSRRAALRSYIFHRLIGFV